MARRVLLTTDVLGGVWDFCLELARELHVKQSARVTLLALGEPSGAQIDQAADVGVRLIVEPLKLEWMQHAEMDVVGTRDLVARLVREVRPDVLHANQFAAACADVDVPVVLTLHSDVLSWRRLTLGATDTPPEWRPYKALVSEALRRADSIAAVSRFLADEARGLYGCGRDIRVIHNGWPEAMSGVPAAERSQPTLVAGRAWDAAKNVSLVVEAAQGWNPGPVLLAGQQVNPESGAQCEVPPPLIALGFLPRKELEAVLLRSRIYLSAARYDPFGLLPLQAALAGCALLLSDIAPYRELWDGAAAFFRSADAADLRRQWSRLVDRPDLTLELASRARRRALEHYTISHMAEAYLDLYGSLSGVRSAVAV